MDIIMCLCYGYILIELGSHIMDIIYWSRFVYFKPCDLMLNLDFIILKLYIV